VTRELTYAAVTPARNEAANLARLADSMRAQSLRPRTWVIVDNDSTDATAAVAAKLAASEAWIRATSAPGTAAATRGAPIVKAFNAGLEQLDSTPDVVVKLDADVTLPPDHFERLLSRFASDERLGLAGGTCLESTDGEWRPVYVARSHVRGAVRAYRWTCLQQIAPLEERMGWDTIDELKAALRGWTTRSFGDIVFYHHRSTGERDGLARSWTTQGELAYYLGYRVPYLVLRAAFRAPREPAAIRMLSGYARARWRRDARYTDHAVREYLREQQRLRHLAARVREVLAPPTEP
jgi:biofilm PGA synthesis N-glycosyltransferase PgaC